MKKELKWTFEILAIPETEYPVYACDSWWGANCYFTRPLYDEKADLPGPEKQEGND